MRREAAMLVSVVSTMACGTQEWSFTIASRGGASEAVVDGAIVDGVLGPDSSATADAAVGMDAEEVDALEEATGCTSDRDCPLPSLHCDATSGQCLACISDTQCGQFGQSHCDSAMHVCVQCEIDRDCAPGLICESTAHQCVSSCADGGGCPADAPLCNARGVCGRCNNAADCVGAAGGPVCDPTIGQCVQCTSDAQCPSNARRCDRTTDRCVRCLVRSDCNSESACDPVTHSCVDN